MPRTSTDPPYVELHAASSFSFLEASSPPEDLIAAAAAQDLPAMALLDRNGVYGAPRFHKAAREAGGRALVGAEVVLDALSPATSNPPRESDTNPGIAPDSAPIRLPLLVRTRRGYRNLCRLLTAGALDRPKGEARVTWEQLAAHAEGLHALTGDERGPLARALTEDDPAGLDAATRAVARLAHVFDGRLHVELQRHRLRDEEHRNRAALEIARRTGLPVVATHGVRHAKPSDKPLLDVVTCIRHHTTLDRAGRLLEAQRERHVRSPREMARVFADLPDAVTESARLAAELEFTLEDLGYRFPDYPLPPGETPASYLRQITWNGARARFRPLTAKAQAQIEKELAMIEKLDLAGYFLIVWDIVRFCQREDILAQGRGSAANSAVCYALSITAVDPVKMDLLFERFLSEERGEWPDIDLDLPSGPQREKVIQYVYGRYSRHGAAMTANVITYRDRSATREVGKVFGFSPEQVDRLAKRLGRFSYDLQRGDEKSFETELRAAGFDPEETRVQRFAVMWDRIHDLPRHLGQHSGGMVIAAGRLDEVVPLEPAAMEGRVVVQWDKEDCADLGIIKVDLLGLGMLDALEEAVPLIHDKEGVHVDLAHLPPDDPKTYEMIRRADTVGVFQIESRAQMASLPRNNPERFYDLVIQVAIIRPGPIVGNLAHPYFERRQGREEVTYPHPSLKPILERTLGVPIFQEQILRIAMVAAGFTGGEAEELRRAMGFKRSMDRMRAIEDRLRRGMVERGIRGEAQDQIVHAIKAFALYGFPESHAASFALIAYASAYLKAHHPTAFYLSLLNAWPMGFYHPATLIQDAQRHGVVVRPLDVQRSGIACRWEPREPEDGKGPPGAIRLGLRFVKGLRRAAAERLETEQAKAPFRDPEDLARRTGLRDKEMQSLAAVGALGCFGLTRRAALWQAARVSRGAGPLLARLPDETPSPLVEMSPQEETVADYEIHRMTTGLHPVAHFRAALAAHRVVPCAELDRIPAGRRVRIGGAVIVRQRPGTAKGLLFLTVEDETGMAQAVISRELLQEHREVITANPALVIEGRLQKKDGSLAIKAERFWPLAELAKRRPQKAPPENVPAAPSPPLPDPLSGPTTR